MTFISASKTHHFNPEIFSEVPKILFPYGISFLHSFSSTSDSISMDKPTPETLNGNRQEGFENEGTWEREKREFSSSSQAPKGRRQNPEKLEDIIVRMMADRPWTTRLQNSIRALVPEFDHSLVYNVIHGAKKPDHALQFFRWVERAGLFDHDRETHLQIIKILGRASMLNHARCILYDMPKKGVSLDEDFFVTLIDSYGTAGIVQESVKIFEKMKELGVERTLKSYNILFKVMLRRGRYMMAKRYFNKMLKGGIEPTTHTYNLMIWGFFLSMKVETAERFFSEMKEKGLLPDVVTYNTMINGYYRVKKMEEAEKMFGEMKGRGIDPTVISYTTMMKGYVSVGKVDDGLKLFEEMKSLRVEPNAFTYSTILPGLCDAEKVGEAEKLLKEMVKKHIAPKDNSIFIRLLNCHCKAGNLNAGSDVLTAMLRLGVRTEAGHYGVLIESFCKAGAFDRAVRMLDKVIDSDIISTSPNEMEMQSCAYHPVIDYLCNNGQTGKAEVLFRQLMKRGVLDSVAFNNLIRGHSREGNPDLAFAILKIMERRGVDKEENAYTLLIESFLRKGEPSDAKTVFDHMIEDGHLPDPPLFHSVMKSLFEDGRVQSASRVMKTMLAKGVKEDKDLVDKIMEALLMRGHVEEALGRIELAMNGGCRVDFDGLLSVLCEKGKTIAAVKLLDFGLERDYEIDFSSYDKVLDTLLAAGKTLNAYSVLTKMMGKGGGSADWKSTGDLIESLNREGNTKQADVLSRMISGGQKSHGSKEGKNRASLAF